MDISKIGTINKNLNEDNRMREYFLNFQNFDSHKNLVILKTKKIKHPILRIDYLQDLLILKMLIKLRIKKKY